ncbi:MAG: hypothetical protein WDZ51_16925 [Pirellulaceae bacterium]
MSVSDTTSVSLDTILDFISSFCIEHCQKTGRRTDGAGLADAIRLRFPGFKFSDIGLEKLSGAVRIAEQRGLVVRHRDVKHLELSPGPQSTSPPGTEIKASVVNSAPRLRPDIWRAFVFVDTGMASFFNRSRGEVRSTSRRSPERYEELKSDPEFVLIDPIQAGVQQEWMREYLKKHAQLNKADAPIEQGQWWVDFPLWLRETDPTLEREWNQFRSGKIYSHITAWANQNNVDVTMVRTQQKPAPAHCRSPRVGGKFTGPTEDAELIKKAIIAALAEMPLEQLENLSIPIRFVIRHFQPR